MKKKVGKNQNGREMEREKSGKSELILYQTEDGKSRLEVRFDGETVWLTQLQMAELFQTSVPNINIHLRNIFAEGELVPEATIKDSLIVQPEGSRKVSRAVSFYNLDVIISLGYRIKSQRGTQFRIWATERLREYIVEGFTLDDDRLKQAGGGIYFEELLERIVFVVIPWKPESRDLQLNDFVFGHWLVTSKIS